MKGLLMTPENAQKCHDGTKTQTRRVIKPINKEPDAWCISGQVGTKWGFGNLHCDDDIIIKCPYSIGEQVYIKETHYRYGEWRRYCDSQDKVTWCFEPFGESLIRFTDNPPDVICHGRGEEGWHKRPSLFLPADLARTIVEINDLRAQQIQSISEADAKAEGVEAMYQTTEAGYVWDNHGYRRAFKLLWNSIHGEGAWERNEWVWAYSFIRILRGEMPE